MKPRIPPAASIALLVACVAETAGPVIPAIQTSLTDVTTPVHFALQFPEEPIFLDDLSSACGFDIFLTFHGTTRGILFFDRNGNLDREIDAGGVLRVSLTSSATSLTYPLAALHTTYDGDDDGNVTVGSTGVVTITGVSLNPFIRTSGRAVFNAVVIAITGEGVPVTDFVGAPIFFVGHSSNPQAICDALI
jgi:hypothetical protein